MADQEIPKVSKSGITIEGKPLEEFVRDVEAQDTYEEEKRKANKTKTSIYHKGRCKYKGKTGRSSYTRILTRREINKEKWEDILMTVKHLDLAIITVLLSGREWTGVEIMEQIKKTMPELTKQTFRIRMNALTLKTDLGNVITVRKAGAKNIYRLKTPALDLSPEQVRVFVYKDYKVREEVLDKYPALKTYFPDKRSDPPLPKKQTDKDTTPDVPPDLSKRIWDKLSEQVEELITKQLGVNVKVSGKVEIVFKFE